MIIKCRMCGNSLFEIDVCVNQRQHMQFSVKVIVEMLFECTFTQFHVTRVMRMFRHNVYMCLSAVGIF